MTWSNGNRLQGPEPLTLFCVDVLPLQENGNPNTRFARQLLPWVVIKFRQYSLESPLASNTTLARMDDLFCKVNKAR